MVFQNRSIFTNYFSIFLFHINYWKASGFNFCSGALKRRGRSPPCVPQPAADLGPWVRGQREGRRQGQTEPHPCHPSLASSWSLILPTEFPNQGICQFLSQKSQPIASASHLVEYLMIPRIRQIFLRRCDLDIPRPPNGVVWPCIWDVTSFLRLSVKSPPKGPQSPQSRLHSSGKSHPALRQLRFAI